MTEEGPNGWLDRIHAPATTEKVSPAMMELFARERAAHARRAESDADSAEDDRQARKLYAGHIYKAMVGWMFIVGAAVVLAGVETPRGRSRLTCPSPYCLR